MIKRAIPVIQALDLFGHGGSQQFDPGVFETNAFWTLLIAWCIDVARVLAFSSHGEVRELVFEDSDPSW